MSSLRFGCSGCAHTLRFNMSHECLHGFKSILCAGHWSVRRLFVTSITCVLLATWRGVLSFANIISRLKRMTSFWCHIAFMFPRMRTTIFRVHWLCAFCYAHFIKCFSYKTTKNTFLPKNDNYLAVHEKPEHIAIFAPTVPHGWFCT